MTKLFSGLIAALALYAGLPGASLAQTPTPVPAPSQVQQAPQLKGFPTPEAAADALTDAIRKQDDKAITAILGIDCPGCGLMRGCHDLVTGNVAGALDHNALLVVIVPLLAVLWFRWLARSWRGERPAVTYEQFRRRNVIMIVAMVGVLAFGVVRNLVPYLGSGIG